MTFEYTDRYDVGSSFIDGIYYNGNDSTVVVNIGGARYRYNNVPRNEVWNFVNAESAGTYYSVRGGFKDTYGPSEYLGSELPRKVLGSTLTLVQPPETPEDKAFNITFLWDGNDRSTVVEADDLLSAVGQVLDIAKMLDQEFEVTKVEKVNA